jgi:hypothetical protein
MPLLASERDLLRELLNTSASSRQDTLSVFQQSLIFLENTLFYFVIRSPCSHFSITQIRFYGSKWRPVIVRRFCRSVCVRRSTETSWFTNVNIPFSRWEPFLSVWSWRVSFWTRNCIFRRPLTRVLAMYLHWGCLQFLSSGKKKYIYMYWKNKSLIFLSLQIGSFIRQMGKYII